MAAPASNVMTARALKANPGAMDSARVTIALMNSIVHQVSFVCYIGKVGKTLKTT